MVTKIKGAQLDLESSVGDPGSTTGIPSSNAIRQALNELLMAASGVGWVKDTSTWTYASADSPTFTVTISGDQTSKFCEGMKIKLTQTTVKYFWVTKVSYNDGTTTLTLYGGTDYTLTNSTITDPCYSNVSAPFGFPLSAAKWTIKLSDGTNRYQANPTAGTFYSPGSFYIDIPIGSWRVLMQGALSVYKSGTSIGVDCSVALSTATNSVSDSELYSRIYDFGTNPHPIVPFSRERFLTLTSKTRYYVIIRTENAADQIELRNDFANLVVSATIGYLGIGGGSGGLPDPSVLLHNSYDFYGGNALMSLSVGTESTPSNYKSRILGLYHYNNVTGQPGDVDGPLYIRNVLSSGHTGFSWGATVWETDLSTEGSGEHTCFYGRIEGNGGSSQLWGIALEVHDNYMGSSSADRNIIGAEIKMDKVRTGGASYGIDILSAGSKTHTCGIIVRQDSGATGKFDTGLTISDCVTRGIDVKASCAVGVDCSNGSYSAAALRIGAGQKLQFEPTGNYYIVHQNSRIEFYIGGALKYYIDSSGGHNA